MRIWFASTTYDEYRNEEIIKSDRTNNMAYESNNILFRSLSDEEEEIFREYARTHEPDYRNWETDHPVCRDEWIKLGKDPVVETKVNHEDWELENSRMERSPETVNRLEQFKHNLYENRIKWATDYCWTYKYGELRIMCDEVWVESIKEEAEKLGIEIKEFLTFSYIASFIKKSEAKPP
jgi:hypothetical protein